MNANELRIGNLVLSNGCQAEVIGVSEEIETTANLEDSYYNGMIEPIPITEDWLEKFGATKDERDDYKTNYHFDIFTLAPSRFGSGYRVIGEEEVCLLDIQFVHELQNLYFALKKSELLYNNKIQPVEIKCPECNQPKGFNPLVGCLAPEWWWDIIKEKALDPYTGHLDSCKSKQFSLIATSTARVKGD